MFCWACMDLPIGDSRSTGERSLGLCRYSLKQVELSRHFAAAHSEPDIRDVILHEIAHALAGHEAAHGPRWKAICRQLGARPERCGEARMPSGRWLAKCPSCGFEYSRFRRPMRRRTYHCRKCGLKTGQLRFRRSSHPLEPLGAAGFACWLQRQGGHCPPLNQKFAVPRVVRDRWAVPTLRLRHAAVGWLGDDLFDDLARDVGQTVVAAGVADMSGARGRGPGDSGSWRGSRARGRDRRQRRCRIRRSLRGRCPLSRRRRPSRKKTPDDDARGPDGWVARDTACGRIRSSRRPTFRPTSHGLSDRE